MTCAAAQATSGFPCRRHVSKSPRVQIPLLHKKSPTRGERFFMAEKEGFEPSNTLWVLHDFQSCALGRTTRLLRVQNNIKMFSLCIIMQFRAKVKNFLFAYALADEIQNMLPETAQQASCRFSICIFKFYSDIKHASVTHGIGCGLFAVGIAENAVTDADILVADALFAQHLTRLWHLKDFTGSVYPA